MIFIVCELHENINDSLKLNSDLFLRYGGWKTTSEIVIDINGSDVVSFAFNRAQIVEIEALGFFDFDRHQNNLVSFHDGRRSRQVPESRSTLLKFVFKSWSVQLKLTLAGVQSTPAGLASIPLTFPNVKLLSSSTSVDMKISPKYHIIDTARILYLTFKGIFLLQLS